MRQHELLAAWREELDRFQREVVVPMVMKHCEPPLRWYIDQMALGHPVGPIKIEGEKP